MALKPHEIERVRMLLREGLTIREVSKLTGHARPTVATYADSMRLASHQRHGKPGPKPRDASPVSVRSVVDPATAYTERCPTCGGQVVMPCVLCAAREHHPTQAERRAVDDAMMHREATVSGTRRGGLNFD